MRNGTKAYKPSPLMRIGLALAWAWWIGLVLALAFIFWLGLREFSAMLPGWIERAAAIL
jgi:hypothetical protein